MPLPAVPGIEQIGEPVISKARNLMDHRQAEQPPEPSLVRGSQPNRDCAVGADVQPAVRIDRMQPATHVLNPDPETGKRVGSETDVKKLDRTGPGRTDQPAALPFDAGDDIASPGWAQGSAPHYLNYRKTSIYGGSNEVQRTIIASTILGL